MAKKRNYKRSKGRGKSFSSYGGKSMLQFAKALAGPTGDIASAYFKKALGLNTEKHWLDTVETNVGTSSTCTAMANPLVVPVGDTVNTRTGQSIRLTNYQVKGRIQANTAATTATFVRVIFVSFKDVRGGNYAGSAFLDSTSRITSQYNMGDSASAGGYRILYDKTFKIEVSGQTGDIHTFKFNFSPLQYHLKWDSSDTTGVVSSLIDNQVRGFIFTSETGANTPNYWADHRIKFVDN